MARCPPTGSSVSLSVYKGKRDALERGNYRCLKLTEQVMKVLERIVNGLIRQVVSIIDDSQFGFVQGRGTTDAIFVLRQLQEKYLAANKRLYMAFVDLEKVFDRVPRKVIWWADTDNNFLSFLSCCVANTFKYYIKILITYESRILHGH